MTGPFTMELDTVDAVQWFFPSGNDQDDVHDLIDLICQLPDTGGQDALDDLASITQYGVLRAFELGMAQYPAFDDFFQACLDQSNVGNDPAPTMASLFCQRKIDILQAGMTMLPILSTSQFQQCLDAADQDKANDLENADQVWIQVNSMVCTKNLGPQIALGITCVSPQNDRYTILIRSTEDILANTLINLLQQRFNGVDLPAYATLQQIGYFAIGGDPGTVSTFRAWQILDAFSSRQLPVLGVLLTTDAKYSACHKSFAIREDGSLHCTVYPAEEHLHFRASLTVVPTVSPACFSFAVSTCALPHGDHMGGSHKYVLADEGIWLNDITDGFLVGMLGKHGETVHTSLCYSNDETGAEVIGALVQGFDGENAPAFADLTQVHFFVAGGDASLKSRLQAASILGYLQDKGLAVMGIYLPQHPVGGGLVTSFAVTKTGELLSSSMNPSQQFVALAHNSQIDILDLRRLGKFLGYYEVGKGLNAHEYDRTWLAKRNGIWTDHMGPCVTVGASALQAGKGTNLPVRHNVVIHSMSLAATGAALLKQIYDLFNGKTAPLYHDLDAITFFVVGGSSLPDSARVARELANLIRQRHSNGATIVLTVDPQYNNLTKALLLTQDGTLLTAIYDSKTI